jgi:hypothetical protein
MNEVDDGLEGADVVALVEGLDVCTEGVDGVVIAVACVDSILELFREVSCCAILS